MHIGAVHLMRQHDGREARGECRPERPPAADDLPHRLVTPQSETERPRRDAGNHAVALCPLRQLETRDGGIAGGDLGEWEGDR